MQNKSRKNFLFIVELLSLLRVYTYFWDAYIYMRCILNDKNNRQSAVLSNVKERGTISFALLNSELRGFLLGENELLKRVYE